ncbi:carbohydrate ABC transporter permease [Streptomyces tsukubensis]|uniref:Sugar ABC transporter permease n=1 Tax=Streptomyces tsukubensis TaxID=83656 RepID=A0A1V4AGS7_9ACTN|nr:carbohydrate ABC transporter permease [Streptomyces tsukubensis]OON82897.1 sugar ABC transporter permease [Streptomyces tsukubensis]QFR91919.1 ABC transporter permease subunit [Streptomyces tsukubensis]
MTTDTLSPRREPPVASSPARRAPGRPYRSTGPQAILGSGPAAKVVAIVALLLMTVMWLIPPAWMVVTSFKSEPDAAAPDGWMPKHGFTADAYQKILDQGNLPLWALNSLVVTVSVTALTVVVSALAAYGFSRTVFRGRKGLLALTLASIMVPPQILIVPLFREMVTSRLADTYAAMILPQVVAPAMVYILKRFFDGIPRELEEAARLDGAGSLRAFWSIVLPLSRPILAAVAIFVFITTWNNFLWPFVSTSDPDLMTLPVGLSTVKDSYGLQYAQIAAASVLASIPLIVVFMVFQRQIVKSVATTGLGGQ